ncbi:LOW QUALITY PROTEIN: G-protein coupled receptor GRL101-like, partial [Pomacea canaliculata]|uniref:LOW QUALITY PROTEIN: G-protein coupled receptor GRL101-like n=1 Tax=Pomacea canaliculata TaxID=400727 RepID=UPI000D7257D1
LSYDCVPKGNISGSVRLETVYADNYKLCCPATLPRGFNVLNCHAPSDEVSSCDDLLRSNLYRVALAIFASLALLGNVGTLLYRFIFHNSTGNVGYDVFVTNLCVADFLMGAYLFIIGIADYRYKGIYLWEDVGWRNSDLCKVAGFTCLLSSEVSVFIIFFITVDRFLVLRFPFSQVRFKRTSAQVVCALSWLTGVGLAAVPLIPPTSHWDFYSQTSICIPLPTSRVMFSGRLYSYGVMIILNLIFFLLILFGQILHLLVSSFQLNIFRQLVKSNKDLTIARRLISVVMSDFLCWFPVGLTGILASFDVPIVSEVNVVIVIFVLPFNSALNPFLYTINTYLERRRRVLEEQRRNRIIAQVKCLASNTGSDNTRVTLTHNEALDLLQTMFAVKY